MPEGFLDELNAALDRYEQSLNQQHAGRAAHVGARAELEAVTSDIMLIVRQLDALNRFRFRSDAESLAAWKSARDVAWPAPPEAGAAADACRVTDGRTHGKAEDFGLSGAKGLEKAVWR